MAGSSSKVGYPSMEIAETSSHSETELEIEAGEATKDSGEVCGLEQKECDDIIEHLKSNPGLVVKSLGQEGQIVLHVAVLAGETKKVKKPKPPAGKSTIKGLSEAPDDSNWYRALERQDCNELMALLQIDPCLVAQTGPKRRTVLHAAAQRGCSKLIDQIFDICIDKVLTTKLKVGFSDLLEAKCGPYEAKAEEMAWFTLGETWMDFHPDEKTIESPKIRHVRDKLLEIMEWDSSKEFVERLGNVNENIQEVWKTMERNYQSHLNYNFVHERKELKFLYAWEVHYSGGSGYDLAPSLAEYASVIIKECMKLAPSESMEVLTYFFQLRNAQGQTLSHLISKYATIYVFSRIFNDHVILDDVCEKCWNARDVRGWTIIHYYAATGNCYDLEKLLKSPVDANTRTNLQSGDIEGSGRTALHLAILHAHVKNVEVLLEIGHIDVNALLYRPIVYGYKKLQKGLYWTPLQLATIMGLPDIVRLLLNRPEVQNFHDNKKLQNNNIGGEHFQNMSLFLLACASGNLDTLRLFLDDPESDPLVKSKEGATALHYASSAMLPSVEEFGGPLNYKVGRFLYFSDLGDLNQYTHRYEEESRDEKLSSISYLGKKASIIMLLQAGVDIWEKDNQGVLADPGPQAPEEALLWWHEQMARETLEAKKSLNDAANAISVVAALVATASFVGPLQPPLGYGGDSMEGGVQDTHLSVRLFMVSNILSFYFAIASIMFAVVPSLPMPQEGIYAEWFRTRRSVGVAIFFLLMSVLAVIISFGTASNSVVSEDYSWQHAGLSFYPTLLGGILCILGISLFFIRLLRLVFHKNAKIRSLYKAFVKF